jgi:tryptophan synthase alpha chain
VPLVLFSYFNPVLQFGLQRFAAQAASAGINGVLITDLTPEEAGDFVRIMRQRALDTIFLAAPTSRPPACGIARLSRGFDLSNLPPRRHRPRLRQAGFSKISPG